MVVQADRMLIGGDGNLNKGGGLKKSVISLAPASHYVIPTRAGAGSFFEKLKGVALVLPRDSKPSCVQGSFATAEREVFILSPTSAALSRPMFLKFQGRQLQLPLTAWGHLSNTSTLRFMRASRLGN